MSLSLKWFDFFQKYYLPILTYLDFYSRKTFHANVKTENPIFVFSVHYLCTSKVNLFFEYVEFSCHFSIVSSQHVRIWSMQQLHYIFAIFALDRDVDAPFQYQKSEREKMHLHLHTDLNLILQFIDYMHTSYFLFFIFSKAWSNFRLTLIIFFRIDTNL